MKQPQSLTLSLIRARLALFGRDLKGSLSVEAVLIFPILIWAYVAMFVFFNAFRAQTTNLKAAYTVGDMLSRELDPVNQAYLDGLNNVFNYLVQPQNPTWIRVTVVNWDDVNKVFKVQWSHATHGKPGYTNATITQLASKIPVMAVGDTVIIVQTAMPYTPAFDVGIGAFNFDDLVITRPRFAPQLLWAN